MTVSTNKVNRPGQVKESILHKIRSIYLSIITAKPAPINRRLPKRHFFTGILDPLKTLWQRLLDAAGSVMIRTKIMGIVTLGFVVSIMVILGVAWMAYKDTADALRNQLQRHGIMVANTLAAAGERQLLSGSQLASISPLVQDVLKSEDDIVYLLIIDNGLEVARAVSGSLADNIPYNNASPGSYGILTYQSGRQIIDDVAVGLSGSSAVVRVGLTENSIAAAGMKNLREMLYLAAAVSVLWLGIAYFLSSILVRPVHRLLEIIRGVEGEPARLEDPLASRKDEISRLGVTFGVMNKELARREDIRKQLLSKVINAQEEERKRIARELHDQTGQSLTSLVVGLKVLESHETGESQKRVADMKQLAANILHDIHNLAVELRPSSLDDLGLIAALRQYIKEYNSKFGIPTDLEVNGLDNIRLAPETEITIYRIIQEALTNIVKHAAATKVSVLLAAREKSVVAVVEDNGKGFDVDKVFVSSKTDHKLGLYGMQERASLIGGLVTIESTWMGTSVFVQAPLEGSTSK